MAPLPKLWDPVKAVDRLPQPFRMIDKILAEIIETSLTICLAKDKQKHVKRLTHIDTVFSPHAMLVASGKASCFTTVGVAGMAVVGTTEGELFSHTARDPSCIGRDKPHASGVTALEVGHISATGSKVVLSASLGTLAVHEAVIRPSSLRRLAVCSLPEDPQLPVGEAPCSVSLSANAGHVAVCWPSGPVAVYEVLLPPYYYSSPVGEAPGGEPGPGALQGGQLRLVLHFSLTITQGLLVGNPSLGTCHVVWQQQQRPDKSGKSDRNHKPARGIYMWWSNCNKLTLSYLEQPTCQLGALSLGMEGAAGASASAGSGGDPPAPPDLATAAGRKGAKPLLPGSAKGQRGSLPTPGAAGAGGVAEGPGGVGGVEGGSRGAAAAGLVRTAPSKGWLLPLGITASCISENGKTLAFGLNDGTILVWDDHFGGHTKILPRMPAGISALAFVNGVANLLFATSRDGSVYLADIARPEDSHMSKTKLPHMATEVYFMPNDPFAICVCPADSEQPNPRLVWFNMQDEKLTAELSGRDAKPDNLGFGRAGMAFPGVLPDMLQHPPDPSPPAPSAKAGKGAAAAAAAAAAEAAAAAAAEAAHKAAAAAAAAQARHEAKPWPMWSFKDTYLIVGGPTPLATSQPATPDPSSEPGVTPQAATPPDASASRESHLYMYKIDAIARLMMPEEMTSTASKSLLDRMLADLDPPKMGKSQIVINKKGQPPQAAAKPASAMRKLGELPLGAGPEDSEGELGGRRHIKFNMADLEGLLDEEQGKGKLFKKETIKGGYSEGRSKQIVDIAAHNASLPPHLRKIDLSAYGGGTATPAANVPVYMQERPKSPPWHHTNPLARIHPDWEEAAVLARIMDKLGSKGGGRRRRERRLGTVSREMQGKMVKEAGPKPALVPQ